MFLSKYFINLFISMRWIIDYNRYVLNTMFLKSWDSISIRFQIGKCVAWFVK